MTREDLTALIDFPEVAHDSAGLVIKQPKARPAMTERQWTEELMSSYDGWRDLVDLEVAAGIELEVQLRPKQILPGISDSARIRGICRADAIVTHFDGRISIIEAKVSGEPTMICGAIGQLIYYKQLAETYWDVEVAALVLASRYLPPYVAEAMVNIRAPIRFLKATDDGRCSGLIPDYGRVQ